MSEDDRPHKYEESPPTGVDFNHVTARAAATPRFGAADRQAHPSRPPNGGRPPPADAGQARTGNGAHPRLPTNDGYSPPSANGAYPPPPNGAYPPGPDREFPAYDHYTAKPVYRPPPDGGQGDPQPARADPAAHGGPAELQALPGPEGVRRTRAAGPPRPPRPPRPSRRPGRGGGNRPRVRKLRLLIVLVPLVLLAVVSAFFGMVMSITSDLSSLEKSYIRDGGTTNSQLLALDGEQLGLLTDNTNRVLVTGTQIPREMKWAIVSVEDKRFYTNSGIDLRGIGRAFFADVLKQRAQQGASTITQQFVKNALAAQGKRTIFEKLREAALAYHLTRQWRKDKILTEYLNSIYYGNGAYGIESAARTYFGHDSTTSSFNCGTTGQPLCVQSALGDPANAALIAGMVASPTAFDPVTHPTAATSRRNLVLSDMYHQGYINYAQYKSALTASLPTAAFIKPPQPKVKTPSAAYFTTWIRQQVVDRYGSEKAFNGGLTIRTTLDLQLQEAAQSAVNDYLANPDGPTSAVVAIDNATGEVRAMVGGRDYNTTPFNLATQGQRQPGSAFKPFVLARALEVGISPDSIWPSQKRVFIVPNTNGQEKFTVNNDDSNYAGSRSLAQALTYSDNSVFAAVGIQVNTKKIASVAKAAGIRTPVSTNYAITLGGLRTGVTPIDMAHAYETLAHNGQRVYGTLGARREGPVGIRSVKLPGQGTQANKTRLRQVIPSGVAATEDSIMHTVLTQGTGTAAEFGVYAAGKTGTTSNYGDAWFVGFTSKLTLAVWVGYPNSLKSMRNDFAGGPVLGGTIPALIWHDFMVRAYAIFNARAAQAAAKNGGSGTTGPTSTDQSTPGSTSTGQSGGGSATAGPSTTPATGGGNAPATPNPTVPANQTPTGTGTGTGTGNGNGTGTQNNAGAGAGAVPATPPTPTPAAPTQAPVNSTPPPSVPDPAAGASGGASAPSG